MFRLEHGCSLVYSELTPIDAKARTLNNSVKTVYIGNANSKTVPNIVNFGPP